VIQAASHTLTLLPNRMSPPAPSALSPRLTGLPPAIRDGARVLVLGSMPGAESLRLQQYYAHPRNDFWRIVEDLFAIPRSLDYEVRMTALNERGVAVWDVLAECVRPGSLDASIDMASALANDIGALLHSYPGIDRVVLNGGFAERTFRRRIAIGGAIPARLFVTTVPSTSPANASIPYAAKFARWRDALGPGIDSRV
jgi:TDG/mug DNA glycosylase family protein